MYKGPNTLNQKYNVNLVEEMGTKNWSRLRPSPGATKEGVNRILQ